MAEEENKQPIPRMRLGEYGSTGLRISHKQIYEESRKDLRWPKVIETYKLMSKDATVSSAINLIKIMLARIDWYFDPGQDADDALRKRTEFLNECMEDMEHSWAEFIQNVSSSYTYGFSVHEKVYRRRRPETGSRFNDGLIGWKKLPIRSQDTISGWIFSEDGRELLGVEQDLSVIESAGRYRLLKQNKSEGSRIEIPRKKIMLFRVNPERDNPEGNSLLKSVYYAWKYRTTIQEQEAIGIVRNMVGTPCLSMPPVYMSEDATPEQKAIYDYYRNALVNMENNEQSAIILPNAYDPETKQPLFKFELLSVSSGRQYDTSAIINRWDNTILTALFADFLRLGQDQVGSFALAGAKTSLMAMAIEARLREIADVINNDLIPQTFALNGWPTDKLPKIKYTDLDEVDLDEFSKAVQRIFSVNAIEFDREIANAIRTKGFGAKPKDDKEPVDEDLLPQNRSRAGDGLAKGAGNGTSDNVAGTDNSAANNEN